LTSARGDRIHEGMLRRVGFAGWLLVSLLAGCTAKPPGPGSGSGGAEVFGAGVDGARAVTPLAEIVRAPERFAGQVVKTEGEIAQVCQRRGCWMELRVENVAPVRVPMAGHSFFLPRDVAGRQATVEGVVAMRPLSESERAHLEAEGALAAAQALQISATGVAIR